MKLKVPVRLWKPFAWAGILQITAFICLLFGVKLWLIFMYGNATPYWDQWDAEADQLYKPFLSGTLHFKDLLSPHNEHHIFTTRILDLTLLGVNKIWNPLLQMVVNAGLHVVALAIGLSFLSKVVGRNYRGVLVLFSLILFSIPFGWENTLAGFQSQLYFVLLFSIICLWWIAVKEPFSLGWWGAVCAGGLAFLSMETGVYTIGAAALLSLVIFMSNLRRTPRQLTAVTFLFVFFAICKKLTPSIPAIEALGVTTFHQFFVAFNAIGSWPFNGSFLSSLIRNLPSLLFVIILLGKPSNPSGRKWFLLALVILSLWQSAGLAYSLGDNASLDSRYKDLFTFMILVNFACLIWVLKDFREKWKIPSRFVAGLWTLLVLISLMRWGYRELPEKLSAKREYGQKEEINTRNFLATGDSSYLKNKQFLEIPYPDANRLAMLLSLPAIRKILPTPINPGIHPSQVRGLSDSGFVKNGYYPSTPRFRDSAWGSYNSKRDAGQGEISIDFAGTKTGGRIMIPVAGYPLIPGIKLEIEQTGLRTPFTVLINPKESWIMAEVKTGPGAYSIHATDSHPGTWVAFGNPSEEGKLDNLTSFLLSHFFWFLQLGLGLLVLVNLIFIPDSSGIKPPGQPDEDL